MRLVGLTAACLPALLTIGPPAMAGHAHKQRHRHAKRLTVESCAVTHQHVLAADAQAHVYVSGSPATGQSVRGCAYGSKRSYLLGALPQCGSSYGCLGVKTVALAGPIVAYGSFTALEPSLPSEEAKHSYVVVVRDLRTDRLLRVVPTGIPAATPKPGVVGVGPAVSIVLKSDGAVAWVVEDKAAPAGASYEVYAADATGFQLLAAGAGIDPASLRLAGSTLQWTQAGQPAARALS